MLADIDAKLFRHGFALQVFAVPALKIGSDFRAKLQQLVEESARST
jgi:hypothetical protein